MASGSQVSAMLVDPHAALDDARVRALPPIVRSYLARALPEGLPLPDRMRIRQVGRLRWTRTGRWLEFGAVHELSALETSYFWSARVRLAPGLRVRVRESLEGGVGRLETSWIGLPLGRARASDLEASQRIRYLTDLFVHPAGLLGHPGLAWHDLGNRRVLLATKDDCQRARIEVQFDGHGDPFCVTALRPHPEQDGTAFPWTARMWSFGRFGGLRIPTRCEARWDLPSGPFVYFRCKIMGIERIP